MGDTNLDVRDKQEMELSLTAARNIVSKDYLSQLSEYEIVEPSQELLNVDIKRFARIFKIDKIVYTKDENLLEKLTTVLNAVFSSGASAVTIIKSDGINVEYYIGVVNKGNGQDTTTLADTFEGTFKGNFAGSRINILKNDTFDVLKNKIFEDGFESQVISSISGIASLRKKDESDIRKYTQGLENMVDSLRGEAYTLLIVADPINNEKINKIRLGYEQLYSQLSPFEKTELTFNDSDTLSLTHSTTEGFTNTLNTSISYTQSQSETNGWGSSESLSKSKTKNGGAVLSAAAGVVTAAGAAAGAVAGTAVGVGPIVGGAIGSAAGAAVGSVINAAGALIGSTTTSETDTYSKNASSSKSESAAETKGESNSTSQQDSDSTGNSQTRGRSLQITSENRTVKTLLDKINDHIERLKLCENYGAFDCAAYVVSSNYDTNTMVASSYNALMRGESSSMQSSHINGWDKPCDTMKLKQYISRFTHPLFSIPDIQNMTVTPSSIVSGQELAIHMGLPKKSISGVSVVESVAFGRNVFRLSPAKTESALDLGCLYHMGTDELTSVGLDVKSLSMHTFITGSTGSGKSNAIYQLLSELNKKNISFLVVEPAKGEYKNVFGDREDVHVFGTNPYMTKLLKINPFKFPSEIHVLEHIDKLIEIFNVCWPMYAAMPAVLKDAVEQAYINAGWDLDTSINKISANLFPTFADVLIELHKVINQSAFSEEVKSNYIGSLVTRVKSLTNGINGRLFSCDEIDNSILFDNNTIVDLSRVGSSETKAMIMGILVMRLQEHRMSQGGMNKDLKHVTVLEEAHNLLKRTSTEQNSEGSNLLGKSVEMLSNTIAEVRTYGEGFIIADQSPGLLDLSVIRNTNTKIILRLPDMSDRELVGKAASLNDDQIVELAKLPTGVAAVYQNDWLEPVLCHIERFESSENEFKDPEKNIANSDKQLKKDILQYLLADTVPEKLEYSIDDLKERLFNSSYTTPLKLNLISAISDNNLKNIENNSAVISKMFDSDPAFIAAKKAKSIEQWNEILIENLDPVLQELDRSFQYHILQCVINARSREDEQCNEMAVKWVECMREKLV